MVRKYAAFDNTNTVDTEVSLVTLQSTEAHRKKVIAVHLIYSNNAGRVKIYKDEDNYFAGDGYFTSGRVTMVNWLTFPFDEELELGEKFEITLTNDAAGTNASLTGLIEYEQTER